MNANCAAAAQLWPASERPTAYGVCMAESGGNPNAHCLNCFPGVIEDSRGEYQINVDAHPQDANLDLYNPTVNTKAAYQIWLSSGWGAWSSYTSGSYKKYLSDYTGAPAASPGPTLPAAVPAGAFTLIGLLLGGVWLAENL